MGNLQCPQLFGSVRQSEHRQVKSFGVQVEIAPSGAVPAAFRPCCSTPCFRSEGFLPNARSDVIGLHVFRTNATNGEDSRVGWDAPKNARILSKRFHTCRTVRMVPRGPRHQRTANLCAAHPAATTSHDLCARPTSHSRTSKLNTFRAQRGFMLACRLVKSGTTCCCEYMVIFGGRAAIDPG